MMMMAKKKKKKKKKQKKLKKTVRMNCANEPGKANQAPQGS